MISWFSNDAPIRTKFNVLAVLYAAYFIIAAMAALYHKAPGTAIPVDLWFVIGAMTATLATALVSKTLICDPYVTTVERMEALAAGDLTSPVVHTDNGDCVGRMTKAMSTFRDNAEQVRRVSQMNAESAGAQSRTVAELGTALRKLSEGNLQCQLKSPFPADYEALRNDFNQAVVVLAEALSAVNTASMGVRTGADEIRKASDDLSRRTEKQAASLEETSAAIGEITSTVRQTAGDAARADESATRAREEAMKSGQTVREAVAAMTGIERTSNEISDIITVIDGISFQTNLLALNAGVEAARAGDAGKGFAVVASEVRALAQRSADAAKDIKARIGASAKEVETGVRLVGAAGDALERIINQIGDVSSLVSTIATAADKQAQGLLQINSAMNEMDRVTQQNAAMVEEATAAAHSLGQEANDLGEQMARFTMDDSGTRAAAPRRAAPATTFAIASPPPRPKLAAVGGGRGPAPADDGDWSEF